MQQFSRQSTAADPGQDRIREARYSYYRRCQVLRRNGERCKAPAEKGAQICHAHAAQQAMAKRRERERTAVLELAVAEMRRRGKPECRMADLLMSFDGIQVTLGVMAQALIDGRIDCKTAGRLGWEMQTMSKLLRMVYRKGREGRKESEILPQIFADERRLGTETLSLINTDKTDLKKLPKVARMTARGNWAPNQRERAQMTAEMAVRKVLAFAGNRDCRHGPQELARAANRKRTQNR